MNPHPLGHYVLIKLESAEEVSEGGIIINSSADSLKREQDMVGTGHVMEFGPTAYFSFSGCEDNGPKDWGVAIGNIVEFRKYEGLRSITSGDDVYQYIPDSHIIGLIK